jgi:N-acetylmuramoyl-L-alanine amidase
MHPLFKKLAQTYVNLSPDIEFPHLKAITLAQWILESGRNPSDLAREHFNFGGLKWREEMRATPGHTIGAATPVEYGAHDGRELYCKFTSLENFIRGYWRFIDRSPYRGWREHNQTAEDYIRFIGPIYTPTLGYADTILNILPETEDLLAEVQANPDAVDVVTDHSDTVDAATWVRIWDDPEGHVAEMSGSQLFKLYRTDRQIRKLISILSSTTAGTYLTASVASIPIPEEEAGGEIPPIVPIGEEVEEKHDLTTLSIAIDVGHGYFKQKKSNGQIVSGFDPGTVNESAKIREVDLNLITATTTQQKLQARGARVSLFFYNDTNQRLFLGEKGAKAQGHDLFVSCHHNSVADSSVQGTETLLDSQQVKSEDKKLAAAIQTQLLEALGLFDRTFGHGFKQQGLGVLQGAHPHAKAKCLVEPFFITKSGLTKSQAETMSQKAGEALANGIAKYWLQN